MKHLIYFSVWIIAKGIRRNMQQLNLKLKESIFSEIFVLVDDCFFFNHFSRQMYTLAAPFPIL